MEENSFQVKSMSRILGDIQVMQREQTAAFGLLTDANTKLADELDGQSRAEKEEEVTSTADKEST